MTVCAIFDLRSYVKEAQLAASFACVSTKFHARRGVEDFLSTMVKFSIPAQPAGFLMFLNFHLI